MMGLAAGIFLLCLACTRGLKLNLVGGELGARVMQELDSLERAITRSLFPSPQSSSSVAQPPHLNAKSFKFHSYKDERIVYARSFLLETACGTLSFKYMAFPSLPFDFPIFGVDIAVLADGGSVCVLDFYPVESRRVLEIHADAKVLHSKWAEAFPLPEKAVLPKSFSSSAIFSRLSSDEQMDKVHEMLVDYASLYKQHLSAAKISEDSSNGVGRSNLEKFLKMRIQTDSIKKLLVPIGGDEDPVATSWAKKFLEEHLYPISLIQ